MADVRHEREVDEHAVAPTDVNGELADRFKERQRLDVADRSADLSDHNVNVACLRDQLDPLLDLIGDVGNNLNGRSEIVAATLATDNGVVDPASGDVRGPSRVGIGEALVMAEIEICLGAVLGDEDFAVLIRRHCSRIDVDVGIELLQADGEAAGDQEPPY